MDFLEISQWCNPRSLLVVDASGAVKRLNCPFTVICIDSIGELTEFKLYKVTSVKSTKDGQLVYTILDALFYHSSFKIIEQ